MNCCSSRLQAGMISSFERKGRMLMSLVATRTMKIWVKCFGEHLNVPSKKHVAEPSRASDVVGSLCMYWARLYVATPEKGR